MKNVILLVIAAAIALVISVSLIGAEDSSSAENIGEKIDSTMTDAGNAIEDKCEALKEKAGAEDSNC